MNWLDFLIIVVIGVAAFMGAKTGLIGALFAVGAVLIGWLLAGRWADNIGGLFGDSLSNDTIITVISYAIILAVMVFLARVVARVVRPLLGLVTLGLSAICRGHLVASPNEFGRRFFGIQQRGGANGGPNQG